ncbi:hypothetical protein [Gilliamella sp. B2838]|uniref:hypothetical protein n=1 Tax=Gilliamella sp. B2838 TaxID=2818020 RepID=UPI00226AFD49|nr:hypothetical protein [Gilliamella sp. B2838]MCX8728653.1 hypothetical protein [Gilliamella sp. B2838]
MRFESNRFNELYDITLTLNPAEKKLCVNYQQAYSFTNAKAKSKQLFVNENFINSKLKILKNLI